MSAVKNILAPLQEPPARLSAAHSRVMRAAIARRVKRRRRSLQLLALALVLALPLVHSLRNAETDVPIAATAVAKAPVVSRAASVAQPGAVSDAVYAEILRETRRLDVQPVDIESWQAKVASYAAGPGGMVNSEPTMQWQAASAPGLLYRRARKLEERGKYRAAIAAYRRIDKGNYAGDAAYAVARCHRLAEDHNRAAIRYERYLELYPSGRNAESARYWARNYAHSAAKLPNSLR